MFKLVFQFGEIMKKTSIIIILATIATTQLFAQSTYDFLRIYDWDGKELSYYQNIVGFEYEIKDSRMIKRKPLYEEIK